ncbi:MAG: carboxypeptidase regulatory-like domain-containing protein [Gammaproteobacteria bacterium]|nr:carboxypeptidase regulatory-like domain-containing protein [Gammaproteobacteria bacterium]
MKTSKRTALLLALLLPACATSDEVREPSPQLAGRVSDLNGRPLAAAAVVLDRGEHVRGASVVTVFTEQNGAFRFPRQADLVSAQSTLEVRLLGYRPAVMPVSKREAGATIDFVLEPVSNRANQVPASAWLAAAPESQGKHLTQLMCTACHQFPSPKVRHYGELLATVPGGEQLKSQEKQAWQRVVRKEAWRSMVMYMRAKTYDVFPEGTAMDIRNIPWDTVQNPEYALFNLEDEAIIADFLADQLPTQFELLSDYSYGAPSAVNDRTVIREYRLPQAALVREVTAVVGSPYIWGADVRKNRLLRLDPQTGDQNWFPVPYEKATGPHTIVGDRDGRIWVSMIENDLLGRFDPEREQWKLWTVNETGTNVFGGQAIVHDIAFDHEERLAHDARGRIWLTLAGHNKMAGLDTQTGEVHHYAAPPIDGRSSINVTLYGTVMSPDGKCAWFSQLNGYVGCFNTEKLEYEGLVEFPRGAGPRRMSIDRNDVLWIPLFGAGQLVKYDARARKELARYDLPDRSAAPYEVTWDERRQVLWVANANADALYRFDPVTERFSVLPLPRSQAYFRQVALHPQSNDLLLTYANIPAGSGPSMVVIIEPGD